MTTTMSTPHPKRVVLDAALTVLRRDGAGGLRVRAVAAEAECSTTGIYTNFGNKNGLVEAIFVDGFERLDQAVADADHSGSHVEWLTARFIEYRRWALANSTSYMVMFGGTVPEFAPSPEASARGFESFDNLVESVRTAIEAHELADGDPTAVAYHLWAALHGFVMLELVHMHVAYRADPATTYEIALAALLESLSASAPSHEPLSDHEESSADS